MSLFSWIGDRAKDAGKLFLNSNLIAHAVAGDKLKTGTFLDKVTGASATLQGIIGTAVVGSHGFEALFNQLNSDATNPSYQNTSPVGVKNYSNDSTQAIIDQLKNAAKDVGGGIVFGNQAKKSLWLPILGIVAVVIVLIFGTILIKSK
ncbi:MAG: hypothetical protein WCD31_08810 [Gillisia sp.]